jgi:2'-5' RNA ligase
MEVRRFVAYSYGCVMAELPEHLAEKVKNYASLIPDEDIYEDGSGEHGREEQPHVTVKYGLHTDNPEEVKTVLSDQPPATINLGGMSAFHNDKYVVLKLDVDSNDLHALNKAISEGLECTDSFPVYKPHVTIAYLNHREDDPYYYERLYSRMFEGDEFDSGELLFSTADDDDYMIPLTGAKSAISARVAKRFLHAF